MTTTTKIDRLSARELLEYVDMNYEPAAVSLWQSQVSGARETMEPAAWHDAVWASAPLEDDEVCQLALVTDACHSKDKDELPDVEWIDYSAANDWADYWTAAYSAALRRAAERIRAIRTWTDV